MKNILNQKTEIIYFLVPGFLGNFSEGLFFKLNDFLEVNNKVTVKCHFKGYENEDFRLDSIDKVIKKTHRNFLKARQLYPNNHIRIIAHSQGCAVIAKLLDFFDKNTSFIFIAPAIYIDELMPLRIPQKILEDIDAKKISMRCEVSPNKFKIIDKKWVDSYRNFFVSMKNFPTITQRVLIIRPSNEYIPEKHVKVLKENLINLTYFEMEGDHSFKNPESSAQKLFEKIINWKA